MKIIIFTLLIFSQSLLVNCTIMEVVSKAVKEVVSYFVKTFKDVSGKIGKFVVHQYVDQQVHSNDDWLLTHNNSMIQERATGSESVLDDINVSNINLGIPMSAPPLPFWQGRDMESHSVLTKDGYYLTIHRVHTRTNLQANRTVLLHHGLLGSSADWILLGGTKSLPYILSDTGYDVWITNARGNYYSRGHLTMKLDDLHYWNFSWQEMGEFDLPAVIDYIRNAKNTTESISFIGHSMGATALLVLLSKLPEYNQYLRIGILLAPIAFMNNIEGPVKVLTGVSEDIIKLLGNGELLPSRKVPSILVPKHCDRPKILCRNPLLFLSGFNMDQRWNSGFITRLVQYVPGGGSTNTLLHYRQVAKNGAFHRFNEPQSVFALNNVTLPIAFISSSGDWLAPVSDVLKLFLSIPNPIDHHIIRNMNFTHTNFVWGVDANALVFDKVMDYLENEVTERNEVIGQF